MTLTLTRGAALSRPDACRGAASSGEGTPVRVVGALGSVLRVGQAGVTVCHCGDAVERMATCRTWSLGDLASVQLARYGPLGVLQATLRTTGIDLPLLLLTPTQILPAKRALPTIASLISHQEPRKTA